MRKITSMLIIQQKIMYATIKGSLTENYGVFSGFSATSYLTLQQQLDTTKPFELVAKINTNSIGSAQTVIGTSANTYIQLGVRGTGVAMMLLGTGGSSFNIGTLYSSTVLSTDTDYWIKGKFTGTKYELYLSTDGTTWTLESSIESSTVISNNPITLQIGKGHSQNWYFNGNIDLPNSYVKIGATKYNLQAVVGYTVVGSPTITDGVVSGFSSSDYLKTNGFNISNVENFEVVICAKPSSSSSGLISSGSGGSNSWKILFTSSQLWFVPTTQSVADDLKIITTFDTNTFYYIKATKKGNIATISYSSDGVNWIDFRSKNMIWGTDTGNIRIGYISNYASYFGGSVDLNKTYIKVNGKLWFNGQEG